MKTQFTTGICANCGADKGLHQFETELCPKHGIEETRFDKLSGKYFPQQWEITVFEDNGIKKLHNAAPELFDAIADFVWRCEQKIGRGGKLTQRELNDVEDFKRLMKKVTA